jgi:hypothetical protein
VIWVITCVLFNILGIALVWAGGWLQERLIRRRATIRALRVGSAPPLDGRAASPL